MSYPWAAHLLSALTAPFHQLDKYTNPPPYPVVPLPTKEDRAVVFAPHPDDETSLVGGYIAAARAAEASVVVVVVSDGNAQKQKQRRFMELKNSLDVLGVADYQCLELPDGRLEADYSKLVRKVASVVAQARPTIIFLPHPKDQHSDHAVVGKAVIEATKNTLADRYAYPDHFPPQLPYPRKHDETLFTWAPTNLPGSWVTFPLTELALNKKVQAIQMFQQELRRPILRSHLLATLRRNEIFEQY